MCSVLWQPFLHRRAFWRWSSMLNNCHFTVIVYTRFVPIQNVQSMNNEYRIFNIFIFNRNKNIMPWPFFQVFHEEIQKNPHLQEFYHNAQSNNEPPTSLRQVDGKLAFFSECLDSSRHYRISRGIWTIHQRSIYHVKRGNIHLPDYLSILISILLT